MDFRVEYSDMLLGYFLTPGSPFGSGEGAWPKPRPPRLKAAFEKE